MNGKSLAESLMPVLEDYVSYGQQRVSDLESVLDDINGQTELSEAVSIVNEINGEI